ncbi:hypothetical protein HMPREF1548_00200 [Clostridium sp. KLE 1755]|nr:hypothetical protein HMPREF1548_00200 [Clostridium sp. KLE 1755]
MMENKGFIKERRAGMYESKLQELLSMDEILRVDPQCAEQACKGLCTGACQAACGYSCQADCAVSGLW